MISHVTLVFGIVNIFLISLVNGSIDLDVPNTALDQSLYEDVLDPELCDEQLSLIRKDAQLSFFFADAGFRLPKGILQGNLVDMGNYHQCIGLNRPLPDYDLQGKYCMIRVPLNLSIWEGLLGAVVLDPSDLDLYNDTTNASVEYNLKRKAMLATTGIVEDDSSTNDPGSRLYLRLAVCIPKPCTTQQAFNSSLFDVSAISFTYTDDFCRLADDKPWTPGDYIAIAIFSLIGLMTILSTGYDVWYTIILKKDPKTVSVIGRSFSVYTNGRRLMTFTSGRDNIECLDGIRALAMSWVVIAHTFASEPFWLNAIEGLMYMRSWESLWVMCAHLTVDTFFMLSGFLVVYTTVGKLTGVKLLKNLHLFYLNRLLRMFPLLAAAVLIEATLLNHVTDGPVWGFAYQVEQCRTYWWSALLHIQNIVNPQNMCISQTWYMAVDVQLHILSPIILVWIYGKKKTAWATLFGALIAVLIAATVYNSIMEFSSTAGGADDLSYYFTYYYTNTLTRASPFLVGLIFGYLVRVVKLEMSKIQVICYWVVTFSISTFIMYSNQPTSQPDWDNQLLDNLFNSFIRPLWACVVGLIVFACVNGYGGPINWFLSLGLWKIHSRLSYAIYLFHYGLMFAVNHSSLSPKFFSVESVVFKFLAHYSLSFLVSFVMTLLIDSPFSVFIKLMVGKGPKKSKEDSNDVQPSKEGAKQV